MGTWASGRAAASTGRVGVTGGGFVGALLLLAACVDGAALTETTEITGANKLTASTTDATTTAADDDSGSDSEGGSSSSTTADDATTDEPAGYCGDKIVQADEECDEGSGNAEGGGCLPGCVKNVCGDGHKWSGVEECDDGEDNADDATCTSACKRNVCGDGLRIKYIEECDNGEENSDEGECTSDCVFNVCGDGNVYLGVEECDDGSTLQGDGCSYECEREQVAFVTKDAFTGDLGGVAGADAKCQEAAKLGGLLPWASGNYTYKAWIADPDCAPRDRFPHADRPYRRIDGYELAWDFDDLVDGDLEISLWCTEDHTYYVDVDLPVWTAVEPNGSNSDDLAGSTCNYWTLDGDFFFGRVGNLRYGDTWTKWLKNGQWEARGCNSEAHLYCIQIDCIAYPEYCAPDYCAK
ncbi:MAG: DUF4215 domain-containing protein [Myxococcales bacterium]|nr:DUF4215 domain-containing protein [Myxococcales bacterium]